MKARKPVCFHLKTWNWTPMALSIYFHRYTKRLSGRSTWQQSAFIDRGPAWSANRGCGWIWTAKCHGGHWGEVQVLQVSYVGKWSRIESTSLAFLWNVVYIYLVTLNRWLSGTCQPPGNSPKRCNRHWIIVIIIIIIIIIVVVVVVVVVAVAVSSDAANLSNLHSGWTYPCIAAVCGHSTLCNACAVCFLLEDSCPVCREGVQQMVHIYPIVSARISTNHSMRDIWTGMKCQKI